MTQNSKQSQNNKTKIKKSFTMGDDWKQIVALGLA